MEKREIQAQRRQVEHRLNRRPPAASRQRSKRGLHVELGSRTFVARVLQLLISSYLEQDGVRGGRGGEPLTVREAHELVRSEVTIVRMVNGMQEDVQEHMKGRTENRQKTQGQREKRRRRERKKGKNDDGRKTRRLLGVEGGEGKRLEWRKEESTMEEGRVYNGGRKRLQCRKEASIMEEGRVYTGGRKSL
eukprot:6212032-Pleurochrysis_carterae.AAC.2